MLSSNLELSRILIVGYIIKLNKQTVNDDGVKREPVMLVSLATHSTLTSSWTKVPTA